MIPLSELTAGARGIVAEITADSAETERLSQLGIVPGAAVEVRMLGSGGSPVAFSVHGAVLALRRESCEQIQIALTGGQMTFLQNSYETYKDYAIVGTKGFTFEGPFYLDRRGRMIGWDEEKEEHSRELVARELERLRTSFELAKADGYRKFIVFLHYPPTNILEDSSGFTDMAEEYGAEQVIYAHCHGESRFHDSIEGEYRGIRYSLVSGDYLRWVPHKILD